MKKLDPKAVWLFFLQSSIGWIIFTLFFSACFVIPAFISAIEDSQTNVGAPIFLSMFIGFIFLSIVVLGLSFLFSKLAYDNFRYELKEDGFYKEYGVINKRYVAIPYERIQNIDINRGVLSRIMGLSDIQIQTAGMSSIYGQYYGAYGIASEGRLPALSVQDAIAVRDELLKRAKGNRSNSSV